MTTSVTSIFLIKIVVVFWFFLDRLFTKKFCPLKKYCQGGWASSEVYLLVNLFKVIGCLYSSVEKNLSIMPLGVLLVTC